jgi:hypothetical protein
MTEKQLHATGFFMKLPGQVIPYFLEPQGTLPSQESATSVTHEIMFLNSNYTSQNQLLKFMKM